MNQTQLWCIRPRNSVRWSLFPLALCLGLPALGGAQRHGSDPSNPVIGRLAWQLYDAKAKRLLGMGRKEIRLKDVSVRSQTSIAIAGFSSAKIVRRRISLGQHFYFDCSSMPSDAQAISGFGITAGRDDSPTFSWEWFVVDHPGHATKLQETGNVKFRMVKTQLGWEIGQLSFPTDISLRIVTLTARPHSDPRWRVKILAGSHIDLPLLRNGKITAR